MKTVRKYIIVTLYTSRVLGRLYFEAFFIIGRNEVLHATAHVAPRSSIPD